MSLVERRDEAAARRDGLRRQRATTLLETGALPTADRALDAAEREVDALDDAIAEDIRRHREFDAQAGSARLAEARAALAAAEAKRLDAVARAEVGARALAESLRDAFAAMTEAQSLMQKSGIRPMPMYLDRNELERRLSGRVSAVLATVTGPGRTRIGGIKLHIGPNVTATEDWRAAEEKLGAADLAPFLNPKQKVDHQ